MRRVTQHLWLLLLPLVALTSLFFQQAPERDNVNIHSTVNVSANVNNFYAIEEALSQVYLEKDGKLIIDAQTEKYLSQAVSYMELNNDSILLEKTFPTTVGKQLLQLVDCYKTYKQTERQLSEHYSSTQTTNKLIDFRALQYRFFGDLSRDLFSDHHAFYENATDVQLIAPALESTATPSACIGVGNRD